MKNILDISVNYVYRLRFSVAQLQLFRRTFNNTDLPGKGILTVQINHIKVSYETSAMCSVYTLLIIKQNNDTSFFLFSFDGLWNPERRRVHQ